VAVVAVVAHRDQPPGVPTHALCEASPGQQADCRDFALKNIALQHGSNALWGAIGKLCCLLFCPF
jgi:hypothetical protein